MPYDMNRQLPAYHLVRPPAAPDEAPVLDKAQQAVVDHAGQPLLVLAGPGTGKTTAIVETVVDRIIRRGVDPERMLVLTFSRKAAEELRERITARLHRTTREPLALTFHSYAYALVRREFALTGDEPPTLLPGPEQLLEVRRLLRGEAEDGVPAGRYGCGPRWPPAASPRNCGTSSFARPSAGWTGPRWPGWAGAWAGTTGKLPVASWRGTRPGSTWPRFLPTTTRRSSGSPRRCCPAGRFVSGRGRRTTWSWSTNTRTPTRLSRRCCTPWQVTAGS